ncbi:hypothetical protein MAPG_03498 [Magnaporthiopsis poae ATCC 64411]|uniref:Peptidase A1 domain-containing protein n=1 Tax=Magnaporthiopsis poae (strain ATCC 64411 / 73-15) TaxID=644358 RepID=A0A0C4DU63_MAGP6|nr:hypothetical protein MAPG_03498 [Magnaporthiopsis poae ATCC 64411]
MTVLAHLCLGLLFAPCLSAQIAQPWPVRWSKSYGPDGPWNAVRVAFGTPAQELDAFPGGQWTSWILRKDICNNVDPSAPCPARAAGLYDPRQSSTHINTSRIYKSESNVFIEGIESTFGTYEAALDQLTIFPARGEFKDVRVRNHSTFIVKEAFRVLPDGSRYAASVSTLALGGPDPFQNWNVDGVRHDGMLTTNDVFNQSLTESNSYGLHIGSPTVKLGGSLFFGGYDRNRVVGPTSSQPYTLDSLPIDLVDIGIGVATGSSPFGFASKSGLLAEGNTTLASMAGLQVEVDPKDPYMYLPQSACEAVAKLLPVRFAPNLGLYLWQTDDPAYKRIVFSPAYLSFSFRANNTGSQTLVIKVPFRLLSLTLTQPIVSSATQYFPCATPRTLGYRLGRAFLQAAFVGVNWGENYKGSWILAQAPGPNIPGAADPTSIKPQDTVLRASGDSWENSWNGIWSPIAADGSQEDVKPLPNTTTGVPISESPNPPAGLVAGMAVMSVVIAVLAVALVFFLVRRRRRRKGRDKPQPELDSEGPGHPPELYASGGVLAKGANTEDEPPRAFRAASQYSTPTSAAAAVGSPFSPVTTYAELSPDGIHKHEELPPVRSHTWQSHYQPVELDSGVACSPRMEVSPLTQHPSPHQQSHRPGSPSRSFFP